MIFYCYYYHKINTDYPKRINYLKIFKNNNLKEYNLYHKSNFYSQNIKILICLIIKDLCKYDSEKKKEILEKVLKELFENYRYDRDYEINNYFKYDSKFILTLLLY